MLSLAELRRAVRVLDAELAQARLQRVVQADATSVVLSFFGGGEEKHLVLSCRADAGRLSLLESPPAAPPSPPAFAQYLRAHLHGVRFAAARLLGEDRQAAIALRGTAGSFDLVLSLLGPRSNVYLLDGDGVLLASLRPLPDTRRELALGQPWADPSSAAPREGVDRWAEVADADYLVAIEQSYAELEASRARDDLLRRLGTALRKELTFLERREAKLGADIASAEAATGSLRLGELLKGVLHGVRQGDTRAVASDYATGEQVEIPLDPKLSPAKNLERLFTRYQKALKGVKALAQQRDEVRQRRAKLEKLDDELRQTEPELDLLRAFAARPAVRAVLARHYSERSTARSSRPAAAAGGAAPKARFGKTKVPTRLLPKIYKTEDGMEIWVGRSDEGNDFLTTRLAHGNDLFFHLDGAAGSHVVLRTDGRKDPPANAILDACELAVHFSKAREETRADVHVAPIKDVKKPRHAKPGLVHVLRGKTVHLRRERARLERVLGTKEGAGD